MKKIIHWLDEYLEITLCAALMSVMTLVIFIQVVMRYVFQNSLTWSEELARFCFIWLIYLGISYGCKIMKHIKIDAALKMFSPKMQPYIVISGELCVLVFAIYIVITGWELTLFQAALRKTSPALGLPLQYVNGAPVVGFFLAAVRTIQTIYHRVGQLGKEAK